MKKLLLALGLLLSTPCYAGIIDLPSYISGSDVTIANMQTTNTTVENWANGNVEGGTNIKAGSIVSQDLSASISTITRWAESFGNFTYTGMLPVTDASLTSTISAGTSYVTGYRVVIGATAHTYAASKDTYVYVNQGGYYNYDAVANGAAAPSNFTAANGNLLLANVTTSGSAITTVTDLRTTSLPITVTTSNFPQDFRTGTQLSRDSTTALHIEAGSITIGSSIYTRTTDTSAKTISTNANWIDGSAPTLTAQRFYAYAYNDSGTSFDIKYSEVDPTISDTAGSTTGILRYYSTGGITYRALGWVFASGDAVQTWQYSNFPDPGYKNRVIYQPGSVHSGTGTFTVNDTIPTTSNGTEMLQLRFSPVSPQSRIMVRSVVNAAVSSAGGQLVAAIFRDSTAEALAVGVLRVDTADVLTNVQVDMETQAASTAVTTFKVRAGANGAATTTLNGQSGARIWGGRAASFIEITEEL